MSPTAARRSSSAIRRAWRITCISLNTAGTPGDGNACDMAISANGRYLTFASAADDLVANDVNGAADVFRYDTQTGTLLRASTNTQGAQGDANSGNLALSGDGQTLAFTSLADNLVQGQINTYSGVFVHVLP